MTKLYFGIEKPTSGTRKCPKCLVEKDVSEFAGCRRRKFGLQVHCKECRTTRGRLRFMVKGFTGDDYLKLLDAQGGLCAICGRPPKGKYPSGHRLHVDHDHKTGKVRELLCSNCNKGLGCFEDSPEFLEQAADYLKKHSNGFY